MFFVFVQFNWQSPFKIPDLLMPVSVCVLLFILGGNHELHEFHVKWVKNDNNLKKKHSVRLLHSIYCAVLL